MRLKQSLVVERPLELVEERRRNIRREAQGVIFLKILNPNTRSKPVRGVLVDLSSSGFRASHNSKEICSGQEVAFYHDAGQGVATVVWTRIVGKSVESGFSIKAPRVKASHFSELSRDLPR